MSMNFTANQFEAEYKASKLRNWEIPRWHPERPCGNKGRTAIVANEKGHLLPGVPRSFTNPWGNFVGTWDLPAKISREEAFRLSAPPLDKIQKWRRHCEKEGCPPPPIPQITYKSKLSREAIAKQEALDRQRALAQKKQTQEATQGQVFAENPLAKIKDIVGKADKPSAKSGPTAGPTSPTFQIPPGVLTDAEIADGACPRCALIVKKRMTPWQRYQEQLALLGKEGEAVVAGEEKPKIEERTPCPIHDTDLYDM